MLYEAGRLPGHPVHRAQQKSGPQWHPEISPLTWPKSGRPRMSRDGCDQRCLVKMWGQKPVLEKRWKEHCKTNVENKTRHCNYWVLILMARVWKELCKVRVVSLSLKNVFRSPVTGASQLLKWKSWSINDTSTSPYIMPLFLDGFPHLGAIESYF